MAIGICCADHVTLLYLQKLALTSPISGGHSDGVVCSRTKAMELLVFIMCALVLSQLSWFQWISSIKHEISGFPIEEAVVMCVCVCVCVCVCFAHHNCHISAITNLNTINTQRKGKVSCQQKLIVLKRFIFILYNCSFQCLECHFEGVWHQEHAMNCLCASAWQ
jgi:hypothetical protein